MSSNGVSHKKRLSFPKGVTPEEKSQRKHGEVKSIPVEDYMAEQSQKTPQVSAENDNAFTLE